MDEILNLIESVSEGFPSYFCEKSYIISGHCLKVYYILLIVMKIVERTFTLLYRFKQFNNFDFIIIIIIQNADFSVQN